MGLKEYQRKRRFEVTPEPAGKDGAVQGQNGDLIYVVQKHQAAHLHYDFRLEWNGVLRSWAIPKGPSLDPSVKRLAVATEDHPLEYGDFEGVIPAGEYGAGIVMLWDKGTWRPDVPDVDTALQKGELKFALFGERLKGSWVLVRIRAFGKSGTRPSWLLIKHRDAYASRRDITKEEPFSVVTRRLLASIARDEGGNAETAKKRDPLGMAPSKPVLSNPRNRQGRSFKRI
jgi:bifunctional non-homologous end joining protein LigD